MTVYLCNHCEQPVAADEADDFHCCGSTNEVHRPGELMPCPQCPDGYVWTINGPTAATCPVCKGHAVVLRNGQPITTETA